MSLIIDNFIDNNYFNSYFVEFEMPKYFKGGEPEKSFENIKAVYVKLQAIGFENLSEAQLEIEFIQKIFENLGYSFAYQVNKKVFGKSYKPDFALFESEKLKNEHYQDDKASNENILALCESKAYTIPLDNKKVDNTNPHFQLIRYLNDLKINFGILTNGQFWRFYNVTKNYADKVFFEIDLEWIIKNDDFFAFQYFYYLFRKEHFYDLNNPSSEKKNFVELQAEIILQVENDLKELIYGENSIIENIGQKLFANHQYEYNLREIYSASLFFAFRLLFIAYFEDKFHKTLFDIHKHYGDNSLRQLLLKLETKTYKKYDAEDYQGWNDLKILFNYLDKGNLDLRIPLLNGGLFAENKAELLTKPWILTNQDIKEILSLLLYHKSSTNHAKTWRDFKTLSVTHIGNIYEGLLESEFRQAFDGVHYLVYTKGKTEIEGYYDDFDYKNIKNDKKIIIHSERLYAETEIYFSNKSNTRKSTASYYTPTEITKFMAENAIDEALQSKQLVKLKIMDNACGSGHFLIETLNLLTKKALERLNLSQEPLLQQLIATEKEVIAKTMFMVLKGAAYELDELTLLKRILLKKIIFGVDLNHFAIELTRLSLWLDTFILGTPLSFIEHHIKQGNALIGGNKKELFENLVDKNDLFATKLQEKVKQLVEQISILSELKDSTAQEIEQSKKIYENLLPTLQQLNLAMNFHTYRRFVPIIFGKEAAKEQQIKLQNALTAFEKDIFEAKNTVLVTEIRETAEKFSFFNYEIEFAEVFQTPTNSPKGGRQEEVGFDMIIGNPPWDKTKFDDKDFFPMWRSSYRTMKQSEKNETRLTVLDYVGVQAEYDFKKDFVTFANEYCKNNYPNNAGAGDNNLFRFFIERNLALLNKTGTLNYVTPSAWIYEDSSIAIRKHIFQNYHLHYFYQFENRKGIFPAVHRSYKFAIFKISHPTMTPPLAPPLLGGGTLTPPLAPPLLGGETLTPPLAPPLLGGETLTPPLAPSLLGGETLTPPLAPSLLGGETLTSKMSKTPLPIGEGQGVGLPVRFMKTDINILYANDRKDEVLYYPYEDIYNLSPEHWALFEVKADKDLAIIRKAYQLFQPLNPEYIDFRRELDMTLDRDLFKEKPDDLILYEGKMIQQFKNTFAAPQYWVNNAEFENSLKDTELIRLVSDIYEQLPIKNGKDNHKEHILRQLEITEEELREKIVFDKEYLRLCFRGISGNVNERTLIAAIIPRNHTFGNSMFAHIPKKYVLEGNTIVIKPVPMERILFIQSIFNSIILDYIIRFIVDMNINKTYLMRLPIPQPSDEELQNNENYRKIISNTLKINKVNNPDLDLGKVTDLPKTEKQKIFLQIENDCLIAKLYGITPEELAHLTSPEYFKVLNNTQEAYLSVLVEKYKKF